MSISEIRLQAERRYICERCGGTGQQPEGSYSVKARSYCEKAGKCSSCNGEGYLGYMTVDHASVKTLLDLIDRMGKALSWTKIAAGMFDGDKPLDNLQAEVEAILKELEQ